jgi:hypothetical protein
VIVDSDGRKFQLFFDRPIRHGVVFETQSIYASKTDEAIESMLDEVRPDPEA